MLNAPTKTFSIRRLQGLCRTNPNAPGISFVPPSPAKRPPTAALRPTNTNGMGARNAPMGASSGKLSSSSWSMGK